jgi:hypothetical protein
MRPFRPQTTRGGARFAPVAEEMPLLQIKSGGGFPLQPVHTGKLTIYLRPFSLKNFRRRDAWEWR